MADASASDWMTRAEIARFKGVTRQSASKQWKRFVALKLITPKMIDKAERVRLEDWNAAEGAAVLRAPKRGVKGDKGDTGDGVDKPGYMAGKARQADADAALKELRLKKELGEVVDRREALDVLGKILDAAVRELEHLPNIASDLFVAGKKGGEAAIRRLLKDKVRDTRTNMAAGIAQLEK